MIKTLVFSDFVMLGIGFGLGVFATLSWSKIKSWFVATETKAAATVTADVTGLAAKVDTAVKSATTPPAPKTGA